MKFKYEFMEQLSFIFNDEESGIWFEYLDLEKKGLRKKALSLLDKVITILKNKSPQELDEWVYNLCKEVLDGKFIPLMKRTNFNLRFPMIRSKLVKEIVLPRLIKGHIDKKVPYSRWLYQINKELLSFDDECNALNLLRTALKLESNDELAKLLLIEELSFHLADYIHELPYGLYGEIEDFEKELEEFKMLIKDVEVEDKWAEEIKLWSFHCKNWRLYLNDKDKYENYYDFLNNHTNKSV